MEAIYDNHNFIAVCEFLPNHLYFVTVQNINNGGSCDAVIPHTDDIHFFNTDNELIYHNFYGDFGPLNINCLYKFCKKLTNKLATYAGSAFYEAFTNSRFGKKDIAEKLKEKFVKKKIVVYYTSTNNEKRANAAFLIGSFAILYLGFSPKLAYKALQPTKLRYRPFQDASVGLSPYKITIKNCLDAIHKASIFGFFNFNDFNAAECSHYENIENGDLNWIIPQKFLAFPGPVEEKNDYYHHPNFYIEYFLSNNVTDIVRLNQRAYDAKCFTIFKLKHHDLYMQDGSDPPDAILKAFLHIAESASGAIAVHCKAGLGRTGSLIGAYLLKHYRMTAKEAIAWVRICRPGSVIGHQQTWLENREESLWREGNDWRYKIYGKKEIVPFLQYGIYSFEAPKKEFPGLRDLLNNLTKRSRYRFIVKTRSKKSKTRLQQVIKNLLDNGKSTKPQVTESQAENKAGEIALSEQSLSSSLQQRSSDINDSKNIHYLKPPPAQDQDEAGKYPFEPEYSQLEYRKPFPPKDFVDPYVRASNYPKVFDYYTQTTSSRIPNPYMDATLPAMYSNPTSFYSHLSGNEHSHVNSERESPSSSNPPFCEPTNSFSKPNKPQKMPTVYSEPISSYKYDRRSELFSKSIDKNWKDNAKTSGRYYPTGDVSNQKYVEASTRKMNDEVCAFDSRIDTISQYSRFNRSYLNKGYMGSGQVNAMTDNDYYCEAAKLKEFESDKSAHGFLLSPEDLQSWVETFEEKNDDGFGNQKFPMKRSSVM